MPRQYGAVPFRIRKNAVEVMLITSRDTGRWLVPKGWPMKPGPRYTARKEAYQESGVHGKVHRKALGSFEYNKKVNHGKKVRVRLKVYPLAVRKQAKRFPERGERKTRWFSLGKA